MCQIGSPGKSRWNRWRCRLFLHLLPPHFLDQLSGLGVFRGLEPLAGGALNAGDLRDLRGDLLTQDVGVAVGGVGVPCFPGGDDPVLLHPARRVVLAPCPQAGVHALFTVPAQFHNHTTLAVQIGVKAQKVDSVFQREDGRFLIQFQL